MSDLERKSPEESGNLSAIESISNKLLEVTRLAEKLDAKLSEAGARTQQTRLDSPRLVSSVACELLKKEERKENMIKSSNEQKSPDNIIEDSNVEEYTTATECSTPVPSRSRSESVLTCSEYEDAVNALARNVDQASSPTEYVLPVLSSKKSEPAIIKPIAIKSAVTGTQEETNCDRAVSMQRLIEEKTGKIVKEVTETTTLRVSHDTRLGVSSYKMVANTTRDNHYHCDVKKMQDLKLTLESETAPVSETNNSETTKSDLFCKEYDSDFSKQANGHLNGFDSKSWSREQEEHSYTSKGSNGSASLIKYSKIKMNDARQANNISTHYQKDKEASRESERRANGGVEEGEFFKKARMVSQRGSL